jgi:hypothetical protein
MNYFGQIPQILHIQIPPLLTVNERLLKYFNKKINVVYFKNIYNIIELKISYNSREGVNLLPIVVTGIHP